MAGPRGFTEYLDQLVNRMRVGDQGAYREFADLLGPVLREYLVSRGVSSEHAETLALSCLYKMAQGWSRAADPTPVWISQALASLSADILQELLRAADLQRRLQDLPDLATHGLHLAGFSRAAKIVSGDFHAVHVIGDRILVAVGDASGKGPAAGLFAALLLGALRTYFFKPRERELLSPELVLSALHALLVDHNQVGEYAHITLGLFEPLHQTVTFATAGGPRPLMCQGGHCCEVEISGQPLGLLANPIEYESLVMPFMPGDLTVFLSDGFADQSDASDMEYGNDRLIKLLRTRNDWTVDSVIQGVLTDLDQFAAGVPQIDDQTMLAIQFTRKKE